MAENPPSLRAFSSSTASSIWTLRRRSFSTTHDELADVRVSTSTLTACDSCGSTCETAAYAATPPSPEILDIVSQKLRIGRC